MRALPLALMFALLGAAPAAATPRDARTLALGGARMTLDDVSGSALYAPALLAAPTQRQAVFTMPLLSAGVGNDALGFSSLDTLLTGINLSAQQVDELLSSIPSSGWGLGADTGLELSGTVSEQRLGWFARTSLETVGLNLPKGLLAVVLKGNTGSQPASIDSLRGARVDAYTDAGLGLGFPLPGIRGAWGVSARAIRSWGFAQIADARGDLLRFNPDGSFSGSATASVRYASTVSELTPTGLGAGFLAPTGLGGALDLSLYSDLSPMVRLSAGLGNLGAVYWSRISEKLYGYDLPATRLGFNGTTDFNGSLPDTSKLTRETPGPLDGQPYWDVLPPRLSLGTSFRFARSLPLQCMAEVEVGTGRGYGVSPVPTLRLGGEYTLFSVLPLRGGVAFGGEQPALFTLGLGLDLAGAQLDLAMGALGGFGSNAKGAYYALGLRRVI